jgi:plasmid stabilization system protein ParE
LDTAGLRAGGLVSARQFVERLDCIGGFSPDAAHRLRRRADSSLRHIARFPDLGRWVPEFGPGFYREILVKPFRILYEFQGDRIGVTYVHRQGEAIGSDSFNLDTES